MDISAHTYGYFFLSPHNQVLFSGDFFPDQNPRIDNTSVRSAGSRSLRSRWRCVAKWSRTEEI